MWTRQDVKARGKESFKANYWPSVGVALLAGLFAGGGSAATVSQGASSSETDQLKDLLNSPDAMIIIGAILGAVAIVGMISTIFKIFVSNPLLVGCKWFFKENLNQPAPFGTVGGGFTGGYARNVGAMFLMGLFETLWSLLFIIPGIVKSYSYKLTPYILRDHPDMSVTEAITLSREMMDGNKWKAFVLDLSFLGWIILSVCTLGILDVFYVAPYMQSTEAALYEAIKENN